MLADCSGTRAYTIEAGNSGNSVPTSGEVAGNGEARRVVGSQT